VISNSMSTAASGLFAQRDIIDAISKNVANVNSEGYKRLETSTQSIDGGSNVQAVIRTNTAPWADNNLRIRGQELSADVAIKDGADRLDNLIMNSNVERAFSDFQTASKNLQAFPESKQYLQEFNSAGYGLNAAINQTANSFAELQSGVKQRMDLDQMRLDGLKAQLTEITSKGVVNSDNANQVSMIQQQIASLTGSVQGYNRFLNSIVPPLIKDYTAITGDLKDKINAAAGENLFVDGKWVNATAVKNIDINNDPKVLEFPDEVGRMKTLIGSIGNKSLLDTKFSQNNFDQASKDFNTEYGVDLERETVKLLEAQRLYEANSRVVAASDRMIGTLLDIMG
jgi:flagellar hook-associated protein FlgK